MPVRLNLLGKARRLSVIGIARRVVGPKRRGDTSRNFIYGEYVETTDDWHDRKDIEMRIEALKGVLVLEKAIEKYTA